MTVAFPNSALATVFNQMRCFVGGGEYRSTANAVVCVKLYSDGGKECSSQRECKGTCLAESASSTVGVCSKDNLFYGQVCRFEKQDNPPECYFIDAFGY